MAARKKRRRRIGGPVARRWFAVGALVLVGLLYYRPLHDYFDARVAARRPRRGGAEAAEGAGSRSRNGSSTRRRSPP